MKKATKSVLEAALELPEGDRATIAEQLLASLSPEAESLSDKAWEKELDRRFEEHLRDPSGSISWDELRRKR